MVSPPVERRLRARLAAARSTDRRCRAARKRAPVRLILAAPLPRPHIKLRTEDAVVRRAIVAAVFVVAAFACGGSSNLSGSGSDGGVPAGLVAISLSQTDVHIPVGTMTAFAVTGTKNDGSRVDVTQQADARSSNQSVATVAHGQGSQIQVNAVGEGTATITVTVGSLQQVCAVTVTSH
jgi:Bacterial Ig-like domain (group 2)